MPKEQSEDVNRRMTDNKQPKEKEQKDIQRSTKHYTENIEKIEQHEHH